MGIPGGEDFWPIERKPFELEELSGGAREGVSSPRDETVPIRAASKEDSRDLPAPWPVQQESLGRAPGDPG